MRNRILLIAALMVSAPLAAQVEQAAPAQTVTDSGATVEEAAPVAPKGTIIMFRGGSIVGSGVACPIMSQGKEITELARGKFSTWSVEPGTYTLNEKKNGVVVTVAAGETKYVRCSIKMGVFMGKPKLKIVDAAEYGKDSYEEKPLTVGAN